MKPRYSLRKMDGVCRITHRLPAWFRPQTGKAAVSAGGGDLNEYSPLMQKVMGHYPNTQTNYPSV
jgi:hypothetical protein